MAKTEILKKKSMGWKIRHSIWLFLLLATSLVIGIHYSMEWGGYDDIKTYLSVMGRELLSTGKYRFLLFQIGWAVAYLCSRKKAAELMLMGNVICFPLCVFVRSLENGTDTFSCICGVLVLIGTVINATAGIVLWKSIVEEIAWKNETANT